MSESGSEELEPEPGDKMEDGGAREILLREAGGLLQELGYTGPLSDEDALLRSCESGAECQLFTSLCVWLVSELKSATDLVENVSPTEGPADSETFQLEVSGVMSELHCPYTSLTCGNVTSRLRKPANCLQLIVFLSTELEAARLLKRSALPPSEPVRHDEDVLEELRLVGEALDLPEISAEVPVIELMKELENKITELSETVHSSPPLFKAQLQPEQWRRTYTVAELENMEEDASVTKQVESLETEMEPRSAQIADLQQTLLDADREEERLKQRWEAVTNIMEAKCALKYLMGELVSAKVQLSKHESSLKQSKAHAADLQKTVFEVRNQRAEMETEYQRQFVELEQQHQQKLLYLLSQLQHKQPIAPKVEEPAEDKVTEREKQLLERLKFQDEVIEKMKELSEKNQQLIQENDLFKQKLALLQVVSGKKVFNTSEIRGLSSPDSPFDFVPPKPKNLRRTTARSATVILEDLLSESEDDTSDKNWVPGQNDKPSKKVPSGDDANNEDQSRESENSMKIDLPGDVTAGSSFFTLPCITPTKMVLRERSDIGQVLSMKLQRQPSIVPGAALAADAQENQTSLTEEKEESPLQQ